MLKPFSELRERLLRVGVAPRHVRRYLAELTDHLADLRSEELRAGRSPAEAETAALARLGTLDQLTQAMTSQPDLQSWSARAPWAVFTLAPIAILAAAWFVALFLLWSGWQIFLPGSDTPFIRIDGLAILYFGVGRSIFFGAPVLAGWAIALVATRQRLRSIWPLAGSLVIALLGGAAQVQVSRPAVPFGLGHVRLAFFVHGLSPIAIFPILYHAGVLLALTLLPYLLWRLWNARPTHAHLIQ